MASFRVRADVRVEDVGSALLVLDPDSSRVYELSGAEAAAFGLVQTGAVEVPSELEPAMAALVELGLVEANGWDRRRVLLAGGAAAAAAGVAVFALPSAAAAQSAPGGGGGGPQPIQRLLSVNYPTRQIDVSGGIGQILSNLPNRSAVVEVGGIAQPSDVDLTGVVARSFREVDASGVPTTPARYLQHNTQSNQLVLGTVPNPILAPAFRAAATFNAVAPLATGSGNRVSFRSLTVANSYIRHSGFVLYVNPFSNTPLYRNDATFERVTAP